MGIIKDLTGKKFGRLFIVRQAGRNNSNKITWLCRCDCGKEKIITGEGIRTGKTVSCGCKALEVRTAHGLRHTRIYRIWGSMIRRCTSKKHKNYKNYGGRGIKVCEDWLLFENFYIDMVEGYSDNLTLDRINNEGNYEPLNCKWSTMSEQLNNRRNSIRINTEWGLIGLKDASVLSGINYGCLASRYQSGWRGDKLFTKIQKYVKKSRA